MNNEITLEIKEYVNAIKKCKWFIITVTLLATLGAAVIAFNKPTVNYCVATTMVPIQISSEENKKPIENGEVQVIKQLMDTFGEILQSNSVAAKVSEKLDEDMDIDKMKSFYSVELKKDSQFLTIKATASTPEKSLDIAKAVAEVFQEEVKEIYPLATFKFIDEPELPKYPLPQGKGKKIALGFLLSLILSIVIVLTRYYFDATIRTKREVEKYLGLSVIGEISKYSTK